MNLKGLILHLRRNAPVIPEHGQVRVFGGCNHLVDDIPSFVVQKGIFVDDRFTGRHSVRRRSAGGQGQEAANTPFMVARGSIIGSALPGGIP